MRKISLALLLCACTPWSIPRFSVPPMPVSSPHLGVHMHGGNIVTVHVVNDELTTTVTTFAPSCAIDKTHSSPLRPDNFELRSLSEVTTKGWIPSCERQPGNEIQVEVGPIILEYDCTLDIAPAPTGAWIFTLDPLLTGRDTDCSVSDPAVNVAIFTYRTK